MIPIIRVVARALAVAMVVRGVWMVYPPLGYIALGIAIWLFVDVTYKGGK